MKLRRAKASAHVEAVAVVGEWVFRFAGGCLIDTPDLPAGGYRWASTLWLATPGQWSRLMWVQGERGWMLPNTLMSGDVVEFGVTPLDKHRRPVARDTTLWYGWLQHATDRAIVVHGPYPTPGDALTAARPLIDEVRLAQLMLPPMGDDG